MELNSDGTVKADSVSEVKRVFFKRKEGETLHYRLATIRRQNIIQLGEIAVMDDRQWVKVNPVHFHGAGWLEVI